MSSRVIFPKKNQNLEASLKINKSKTKSRIVNLRLDNKLHNNLKTSEKIAYKKPTEIEENKNKKAINIRESLNHKKELSTDKIFYKNAKKIAYSKSGGISESVVNLISPPFLKNNKLMKMPLLTNEIQDNLDINVNNTLLNSVSNPFREEREYLKSTDNKTAVSKSPNPLKKINQLKSPKSKELEEYKKKKLKQKKSKSKNVFQNTNRFLIKKLPTQKTNDNGEKVSFYTNRNNNRYSINEKGTIHKINLKKK